MTDAPDQVALGMRFYAEAGGIVELYLIEKRNAARLNERANAGEPTAVRIMRSIGAFSRTFDVVPDPEHRPVCLACETPFRNDGEPAALACTSPPGGDWCVAAALCHTCAESGAIGKATAAWRRQWPSSTIIPMVC